MTDWRDIEAGPELDRLIAERMGWQMIELENPSPPPIDYRWRLVNPEGRIRGVYGNTYFPCKDIEEAWQKAGEPDMECGDRDLPPYSTDLDVAFTLITEQDGFSLSRDMQENVWMADLDTVPPTYEVADMPALAICRAWLAYTEKQAA